MNPHYHIFNEIEFFKIYNNGELSRNDPYYTCKYDSESDLDRLIEKHRPVADCYGYIAVVKDSDGEEVGCIMKIC